jgi:hypothetical protein
MAVREKRITVRVPAELIRSAVELRLAAADAETAAVTAWDHLNRARLIGAVRSEMGDLSTNPKHFKGFGSR